MSDSRNTASGFPDPLAEKAIKEKDEYGLKYARAIENQWGSVEVQGSLFKRRLDEFDRNRAYANGTQDTRIYKQILNSLDPNNGDGTLLSIDWSPVPIIPKFVRIVVNKILAREPQPNVEAIDPLSITEKERKKATIKFAMENRDVISMVQQAGVDTGIDLDSVPATPEEAEIFEDTSIKTSAEIAAQIATRLTLGWSNFNESILRRNVNDLVALGMGVIKRENDPNYGIIPKYIDPRFFVHSYTEDPYMGDLKYAGHIERVTIQELKRLAGDQFSEDDYKSLAASVSAKYSNNPSILSHSFYDRNLEKTVYAYDEYIVEVMDFEFMSIDDQYYEQKGSRHGNEGFYFKGYAYKPTQNSVFERKPHKMTHETVYGGKYILGTKYIFNYGCKKNTPRNIHDITKTRMSYSAVATNLINMVPKSMVSGVVAFGDQLQITHLKLQQAIAKAKPDGLMVDIEGLENVQLGKGGALQPLEIQDIYEQTGVFYYRSKNPEGNFQNPPVREINNAIRNIEQLIRIYNHYLSMIRDATGLNEFVDGSTPKTDALVGVAQQASEASNNATYDTTHATLVLYRRVCEDIVKCIQILPSDSVIYKVYEKAIGQTNMSVLNSFKDLPMYNFGVFPVTLMSEKDSMYLEGNIQQALAQREIDIEDAIAIRNLKDVDQAERLLVLRRKKRRAQAMEEAQQNSRVQGEINQQVAVASEQAKMQTAQMQAQADIAKIQAEAAAKAELLKLEYNLKMDLERVKQEQAREVRDEDKEFRMNVEKMKEQSKDERLSKQTVDQSKLISQRQGKREELTDEEEDILERILGDGQ
jgi:hypothetical protein